MVSFYESNLRVKLEREAQKKKSITLQNLADNDIGSITKDLVKADPEYGAGVVPQYEAAAQTVALQERWAKLNQRQSSRNSQYNAYGAKRKSPSDDDKSWI